MENLLARSRSSIDLPREVQLKVLELLSATQLLSIRVVSKAFQMLINQHEATFAKTTLERRIFELRTDMSASDCSGKPTFEALKQWTKAKGIWLQRDDLCSWHFTILFASGHKRYELDEILSYVSCLLKIHLRQNGLRYMHVSDEIDGQLEYMIKTMAVPAWAKAVQGDFDESDLRRVVNGELADTPIYCLEPTDGDGSSEFPHRTVSGGQFVPSKLVMQIPHQSNAFMSYFGLPLSPEYKHRVFGRPLASYCVNTRHAHEFRRRWAAAKSKEGRSLVEASDLEFVYVT